MILFLIHVTIRSLCIVCHLFSACIYDIRLCFPRWAARREVTYYFLHRCPCVCLSVRLSICLFNHSFKWEIEKTVTVEILIIQLLAVCRCATGFYISIDSVIDYLHSIIKLLFKSHLQRIYWPDCLEIRCDKSKW